jgi:hypothetical protein
MRAIRTIFLAVFSAALSAVIASTIAYFVFVRPRLRTWGLDPTEADLPLPGDDLVPQPTATETRGIIIEAPVAKVWPWLVQMGFGRAGWYSYDALDNKGESAESILPEYQDLKAGDIMPTHPGGGFLVKTVETERALVLYTDTALVREQAEKARAEDKAELPTVGLKMSGGLMSASFPEFAASWTFFLKPIDGDRTRLVERFRAHTPGNGPATVVLGEIMGTGIILMTRKQMIGIKERVERPAIETTPETTFVEPELEPIPAN